jgi:C_GCAxxG_C_C family probable redox protein
MVSAISDKERDDVLAQKAKDALTRCANCAQASFAVLQDEFNLEGKDILKALTPFPGIALRGETCGAVIGSLMAIGLVYGREDLDDWKGYIASLPSARKFCKTFEEKHGSTSCETIIQGKLGRKFNLADHTEALEYASSGGPQACGEVVASAVLIAADALRQKIVPPTSSVE